MYPARPDSAEHEIVRLCRYCGAAPMREYPVLHHFECAYVGPDYDFKLNASGARECPKCLKPFKHEHKDWEEIGRSYRCDACQNEDV